MLDPIAWTISLLVAAAGAYYGYKHLEPEIEKNKEEPENGDPWIFLLYIVFLLFFCTKFTIQRGPLLYSHFFGPPPTTTTLKIHHVDHRIKRGVVYYDCSIEGRPYEFWSYKAMYYTLRNYHSVKVDVKKAINGRYFVSRLYIPQEEIEAGRKQYLEGFLPPIYFVLVVLLLLGIMMGLAFLIFGKKRIYQLKKLPEKERTAKAMFMLFIVFAVLLFLFFFGIYLLQLYWGLR